MAKKKRTAAAKVDRNSHSKPTPKTKPVAKKKMTSSSLSVAKKSVATKPATKQAAPKKKEGKRASKGNRIVFDEWNTFVGTRGDVTMVIAFDDLVTRLKRPANLELCARVLVPIQSPRDGGGPDSPERERLWDMEDELIAILEKHHTRCRLVARLTYGNWREIVFQVHDWDSFRPPVGMWMMKHKDYGIDVSEHKGWEFFDAYVNPTSEDRVFMADQDVIRVLIENGSDPDCEHSLEYAFQGDPKGLRRLAKTLVKRGYQPIGNMDYDSGAIELAKQLTLDVFAVSAESIANDKAAEKAGVECAGWGAMSVH